MRRLLMVAVQLQWLANGFLQESPSGFAGGFARSQWGLSTRSSAVPKGGSIKMTGDERDEVFSG